MYKTQETVKTELKELFDIDNNLENGTYETNGKFGITKKQMTRGEVLEKLQNYFNGVGVKDGYVSVDSITFVHTTFEICNGHPS
tara:strand:- start:419 stop:670 length:252 start_codon:yes stop_codon:yes gene_type:complete